MRAPSILQPETPQFGGPQPAPFLKQTPPWGSRPKRTGGGADEMEAPAMLVGGDVGAGPERQHGLFPSVADLESAGASAGRRFQIAAGQAPRHPLAARSDRLEQILLGLLDLIQTSVYRRDALASALTLHIAPALFHLEAGDLHVAAVGQGDLIHPAG